MLPYSTKDSTGMWLLLEDAAKHLGIPFENDRQFKRDSKLDISRYFDVGASCLTAAPFNSFIGVCVLKDAPIGWNDSANTLLTLSKFVNMCVHLSNINNWLSTANVIPGDFATYTGKSFNPCNVRLAFCDGVLYSVQSL